MKKTLVLLLAFLPMIRLSAQVSEVEEVLVSTSNDFIHYSSVVRNYNDTINILMLYGRSQNDVASDSAVGHCTFYTQNTNTGEIKRLFDMPRAYKINDIRFVTLRKISGVTTEDFCCFCGTRSQFEWYEYPLNPGSGALPIEIHSKHGFAGFFSMTQALNPTATYSAKVRDVENTKELYRMTCYAESGGMYSHYNDVLYLDNAVLDIIGLDDTVNAPSCFCRVKFYPNYPVYGVFWDNNMRYNNTEVLTDITKTDDFVVTVSHNTIGDSLWVRHSGQEYYLFSGGMELNDHVNAIGFDWATIGLSCKENEVLDHFVRMNDAKICQTTGNETELAFYMNAMGYGGLVYCRYNYDGLMHFKQGAYLHSLHNVKEVLHMPLNDATAIINTFNNDYVTVLNWKQDTLFCNYPVMQFYQSSINAQSISLQRRNGYEHLLWSGRQTNNTVSNMFLMTQRGEQGGGYNKPCHEKNTWKAQPITIDHDIDEKNMNIQIRYPYDYERYPVTYINFNPQSIDKNYNCVND